MTSNDTTYTVTIYTGPKWIADAKVKIGEWIEERRKQ